MISRTSLRAAALGLAVPIVLAMSASPVLASEMRDDGDQPAEPLGWAMTLLIFVGIPLLVFLLLALAIYGPSSARGPRYRPGVGWWAAPVWFNGPDGHQDTHGRALEATRQSSLAGPTAAEQELGGAGPGTDGAGGPAGGRTGAVAATRLDVWEGRGAPGPTGAGAAGGNDARKGGTSARW